MKKVLISRELDADSVFRQQLEAAGFAVHGESLIILEAVPFDEVPETDWIFFYSKNAVRFFFAGLQNPALYQGKQMRQGPALRGGKPEGKPVKYAAYGKGTASYLRIHHHVNVKFVGSAKPARTAEALATMAAGERILFPCARHSRHALYKYLRYRTNAMQLVVYDNRIREDLDLPEFDILVFTSPLNAEAYCKAYQIQASQQVVAIGRTTATELRKLGVKNVIVAKEPGEEALADEVLKLA